MAGAARIVLLPDAPPDLPTVPAEAFDVVVVGAGAAGFSAALTAADAGANVIMLEKGKWPGGTTRRSGGQYWVPNNSLMRSAGMSDDEDDAVRYMARLSYPTRYDPGSKTLGISEHDLSMLRTYAGRATQAVDALAASGALVSEMSLLGRAYPNWGEDYQRDYHADLQEPQVLGRHLNQQSGQSGTDLIAALTASARRSGIPIRCLHRVVGLLVASDERVVGVVVDSEDGRQYLWARRGVIFGSGGFAHNKDMTTRYLRGQIMGSCAVPANTGDFQRLAAQMGVPLGNMGNAWWNQVAVEEMLIEPSSSAAVWLPYGDAMMLVNRFGKRVVNEKAIYNERSQVHFAWDATKREYPNHLLFMMFDHKVASSEAMFDFRWPVPLPRDPSRVVIRGDWWEELAERVDRRLASLGERVGNVRLAANFLDQLLQTIGRFNRFSESGVDEDFGRERTSRLAWHAPTSAQADPAPLMRPFPEDGPFYCVILGLGALDTKGGPEIDEAGQVLSADGRPIVGLYGAGNCVASPAGQAYWSAGATIGLALTFGYIAASDVVTQPPADVEAFASRAPVRTRL
jgi:succinate dehydrogenase/fumarate reductase flavoprotein subunit